MFYVVPDIEFSGPRLSLRLQVVIRVVKREVQGDTLWHTENLPLPLEGWRYLGLRLGGVSRGRPKPTADAARAYMKPPQKKFTYECNENVSTVISHWNMQ